ncbi:MAG TPA: hypothetical protein VL460_05790 [Caulobacteraceae bacterium]|jgi:hypothetical protein|nr:hypothetical protein [Caulobacteraceae bacterium]
MPSFIQALPLALACAAWALTGAAAAAELKLVGLKGEVRLVGETELKAMPRVRLKLEPRDIASFEGVPLGDLLAKTGLAKIDGVRGPMLAVVIVVRASDGYVVALPLSDLDPAFRSGRIVLADTWNDKPLAADEGPFHLIVEGDARPARSAHSVVSIELRSLR